MSFQPFNLLFYKGDSIISRLIKWISKGKYSHCALFLDTFHTLEVSWNNPSVIKHFDYKYKKYDVYTVNIRLTDYQKQIILQYITNNISSGYDWIYLFTRGLNILFGTPIKNSEKYFTCDELIYEAFKLIGIHLIDEKEILTPSTLSKSKYLTSLKRNSLIQNEGGI